MAKQAVTTHMMLANFISAIHLKTVYSSNLLAMIARMIESRDIFSFPDRREQMISAASFLGSCSSAACSQSSIQFSYLSTSSHFLASPLPRFSREDRICQKRGQ
jgi:hypothetical protein